MRFYIVLLLVTAHAAVGFREIGFQHLTNKAAANATVALRKTRDPKNFEKCGHAAWKDAPVVTLLSGTGEGKSTTCNVLARSTYLAKVAEETQAESETSESCIFKTHWFYPYDKSEPLTLVDTPGFGDTRSHMIERNNNNIVATLKKAKRLHVILWVLNADKPKVEQARQQAFKFVRSYFGRKMYNHLVFVYTRFQWRKKSRFGKKQGQERVKFLDELHGNMIHGLLREVEAQFWVNGEIGEDIKQLLLNAPYYGINLYVEENMDELYLSDADLGDDEYDDSYPDGAMGVYNPEKSFKPNSATQLIDMKKEINRIWDTGDQVDSRHLKPYDKYCNRAAVALDSVKSAVLGGNILDCVLGELWKTLIEEVIPRLKEMKNGNVKAIMGLKAHIESSAAVNFLDKSYEKTYDVINKYLPLDNTSLEAIDSFTSWENYGSCYEIPTLDGEAQAMALYRCLGGIKEGKRPRLVRRKIFLGYFDTIRPENAKRIQNNVELLPDDERDTILQSPHCPDFEKMTKNPQLEKIGELNDKITDLTQKMNDRAAASQKEKDEWKRKLKELEDEKKKEVSDLRKDLDKATNKKR